MNQYALSTQHSFISFYLFCGKLLPILSKTRCSYVEKLVVPQLLREVSALYGNRKFKLLCTCVPILSSSNPVYTSPFQFCCCLRLIVNPLNPELNPMCCLLALLGVHHFLHVSRIRVKSLTLRRLMSYIYMEHLFLMFLDHTQRRSTVGRTPLDE